MALGALLCLPVRAQSGDAAMVDCLFPGQVRHLGLSTVVTPRRQARVTVAECRAGGGEYVEPTLAPAALPAGTAAASIDPPSAGRVAVSDPQIWLPLAAAGVVGAQVALGELYERLGDAESARTWYERASQQGSARATVDLASMYERGQGVARDPALAHRLILQAAGMPAAADSRPRIQLIDPANPLPMRSAPANAIEIDKPAGPLTITGKVEAAAGVASLTANGQSLSPDAEGLFTLPVQLGSEPLDLKLEAVDRAGASTHAEFVLRRQGTGAAPADVQPAAADDLSMGFGKRIALVIANQDYRQWEHLDTPLIDGRDVAQVLRSRFGFEVNLLTNATRQSMLAALSQLRSVAGPDDQVIVYYAGHGQMDPVTARGYWIPVDGGTRDLSNWVSVIDVTDQLAAMQARHVLVIADSCYSGTLAGSLATRIDEALAGEQRRRHLTQLTSRRARVAFTSGGLEPVIDGGAGKHSLFARSLLDVLGGVQGPVSAHELSSAVSARFELAARPLKVSQHPAYAPIAFAGHEAGDFVLAPVSSGR